MSTKPNPIPEPHKGGVPYLSIDGAAKALEFYKAAFGAEEVFRMPFGDKIGHAEIRIGAAPVMMSEMGMAGAPQAPAQLGGSSFSLLVYVPDVDALCARAVAAGAVVVMPLEDRFYGDRVVLLRDPFGHFWNFATHVEDVPPDELFRRAAAFQKKD